MLAFVYLSVCIVTVATVHLKSSLSHLTSRSRRGGAPDVIVRQLATVREWSLGSGITKRDGNYGRDLSDDQIYVLQEKSRKVGSRMAAIWCCPLHKSAMML